MELVRDTDCIIADINNRLNVNKLPEPETVREEILSILRRIAPQEPVAVTIMPYEIYISDLIKKIRIKFNKGEEPAVEYDDGNYTGIGWEALHSSELLKIKERLDDILEYILLDIEFQKENREHDEKWYFKGEVWISRDPWKISPEFMVHQRERDKEWGKLHDKYIVRWRSYLENMGRTKDLEKFNEYDKERLEYRQKLEESRRKEEIKQTL